MAFYKELTRVGRSQRRIRKQRKRPVSRMTKGTNWFSRYAPNPHPDGFAPSDLWANNRAYYNYAKERAERRVISQAKVRGRRAARARLKQELRRDADVD